MSKIKIENIINQNLKTFLNSNFLQKRRLMIKNNRINLINPKFLKNPISKFKEKKELKIKYIQKKNKDKITLSLRGKTKSLISRIKKNPNNIKDKFTKETVDPINIEIGIKENNMMK